MATSNEDRILTLNGKKVTITHQRKLYWPDEKITKGQLVDYYLSMADYILPHIKDRALSLHRFPNGIKRPGFYQKDLDLDQTPDWIRSVPMLATSTGKEVDYLVCNNAATLAYMVNLGCIEINPWLSRIRKPETPDYAVLDLDPEQIDFKYVVETAQHIRELLGQWGISCYVKTSGSRGLHIYIPLAPKHTYDDTRAFAGHVATTVNAQLPATTSIIRSKSQRNKKVYIDFLQNSRGQTVAAPYSVRPKPGATVSMPLYWEEVHEQLNIHDFDISNSLQRLHEKGEIWQDMQNDANDLRKIMRTMTAG